MLKGLKAGDQVAAAGGFLIDAETRLNPAAASTYFGASGGPQCGGSAPATRTQPDTKVVPSEKKTDITAERDEYIKNIEQLPQEDWQAAKAQAICPISGTALGSMGMPVKITLRGKVVFVCCQECVGKAKRDPDGTLKKIAVPKP